MRSGPRPLRASAKIGNTIDAELQSPRLRPGSPEIATTENRLQQVAMRDFSLLSDGGRAAIVVVMGGAIDADVNLAAVIGSLNRSPRTIMAQAIRAILLGAAGGQLCDRNVRDDFTQPSNSPDHGIKPVWRAINGAVPLAAEGHHFALELIEAVTM